jgi:capsular polysaccharide biosynthesis protein
MSQQALDLRNSIQIVRQHKVLVGILVALAILGGAAYAVLKPAMLTSTALVALPSADIVQPATNAGGTSGSNDPFTATQEVVAGSYRVLAGALPDVRPAMSLSELRRYVQIGSPSPGIISVSAKGGNAASAEATANAVANSYIGYVGSKGSAVGHVKAQLLESATTASGPAPAERLITYALLGGLAGALIGFVVALAIGRNDRRLRQRDEVANSIGIPVLASLPVAHPSTAAAWTKLFEGYKPTARESWQLRTALDQLGMLRLRFSRPGYDDSGTSFGDDRAARHDSGSGCYSVAVMSLSSDARAVALGPQLAVIAASQGIPTWLVVGPQQDMAVTASLRIACAAPVPQTSKRQGLLRVTAYEEGGIDLVPDAALVIVVVVVNSRAPEMPATMQTNATVIGVSAGAATAEQLAKAAVAATADGREINGILVANPLDTDQTTGRIPQLAQSAQPRLPNRLRGIVTEIRR